MKIIHATLENCAQASGLVVVLDVIRAFTTATYAFEAGIVDITLVSGVDEALALKSEIPNALVMGEEHGLPPDGFDFGNSPSALMGVDLTGRRMIQRTSAGTQGVVRSRHADLLLASSFRCAQATVDFIQKRNPDRVTIVNTGYRPGGWGDEDEACFEYLEALLQGEKPEVAPLLERVRGSRSGQIFPDPNYPLFPEADLDCATDIDGFGRALLIEHQNGRLVMRPVH